MRWLAAALALVPCIAMAACTQADPEIVLEYAPYEGDAFPERYAPVSVPEAGMGLVTDSRSDTISLVDLGTGQRFASYPVGREPVTIDGPHHVAVDLTGRAAYVALSYPVLAGASGPHATHGSSTVSGWAQKLSLIDFRVLGQVRVDPNPGEIQVADDQSRLVVSHFDLKRALDNPGNLDAARSALVVIDPGTMKEVGSPEPTRVPLCIAAHGMVLSRPDGARAYVACYGEDSLAIAHLDEPDHPVDLVPLGPGATIGAPSYGPYGVVMSPDQKQVAVSSTVSNDVRFFDIASGAFDVGIKLSTQGVPYFVAYSEDGSKVYVPTQAPDALVVFDRATGAQVAFRDLSGACNKPHVANLRDGSLYVVCEGDQIAPGRVVRIDPTSLDTIADTEVGVYPDAFVRVPGGSK